MKVGDKVRLTKRGLSEFAMFFKDGIYENLEIESIHLTKAGKKSYVVWQHNKEQSWFVSEKVIELMDDNEPNTWRRNKPVFCKIVKNGKEFARHFYKLNSDGEPLFYVNGKKHLSLAKEMWMVILKLLRQHLGEYQQKRS